MIKRHYYSSKNEKTSDFTYMESQFNDYKSKLFQTHEIYKRLSSLKIQMNHFDMYPRVYNLIFYEGIFLQKNIGILYYSLYYFNLFGFLSYQKNYNSSDTEMVEYVLRTGKMALYSIRDKRLLEHNLLDYMESSIILRDSESKAFYANITYRESIEDGRYHFAHAQDLEQLYVFFCSNDEKKIITHLQKMQSMDYLEVLKNLPYRTDYQSELVKYLIIPAIEVFVCIFAKDEKGFNRNLLFALEQHKLYYESTDNSQETRRDKHEGWVSLLLTCACVIAHDKGMKREVESDYIPEWLVKGEFEGLELVVE